MQSDPAINRAVPASVSSAGRVLSVSLIPNAAAPVIDGADHLTLTELAALVRSGRVLQKAGAYDRVDVEVAHLAALPRPFILLSALRLMSRGTCRLTARDGAQQRVGFTSLLERGWRVSTDGFSLPFVRRNVKALTAELEQRNAQEPLPRAVAGRALLVRSDLWLGVTTGGAIAHTAGIANAFAELGEHPLLAGYESNPILAPEVEFRRLTIPHRFWDYKEAPQLQANLSLLNETDALISEQQSGYLYHRLAMLSIGAALAARRRKLALILEYNGSEVWIARNWGQPLYREALAARMEQAVLQAASTVVVVSEPLRRELLARGIEDKRIVVAANAVDTTRFAPTIDGRGVRDKLGISDDEIVTAFLGTFSIWHGVLVLIDAFARLSSERPEIKTRARLLLIGDGPLLSECVQRTKELGIADRVTFTGRVAQADAPRYLAAADILAATHIPNADGSEFFGSPTKLFEYMAMGKAILASRLAQLGEVLEDGTTAVLVEPGDLAELSQGLARLCGDAELRTRLGQAARDDAVHHHRWGERVARILANAVHGAGR